MANNKNSNNLVVPGATEALNQMKLEIAKEFGFDNYDGMDKGELTARQNGYIGGEMTRRLIKLGEQYLAEHSAELVPSISKQLAGERTPSQQDIH